MKKILLFLCILTISLFLLTACSDSGVISNLSSVVNHDRADIETDKDAQKAFSKSTPENDTDMGLKSTKIDSAETNLTDEQKLIMQYFQGGNYFKIWYDGYDNIRRYPQVFDTALISISGIVEKVLSQTDTDYRLLINNNPYGEEKQYFILEGENKNTLFMENDEIYVEGRSHGLQTMEFDGVTYTAPLVSVHGISLSEAENFTQEELKTIAKTIFGDNLDWKQVNEYIYEAQLENQSNSKFSSYYLSTAGGAITDASNEYWEFERRLEFSSDFEHFLVTSYDWDSENLTFDYYDNTLTKIWHREFAEVEMQDAYALQEGNYYDYTKNNIYCMVNNELYIINTQTGEDTFEPIFVGSKINIRKVNDGILLFGTEKADAVMKITLDGNMLWKTNVAADPVEGISNIVQINEDTILVEWSFGDYENCENHFLAIDNQTGEMIVDAVEYSSSEY